MTIATQLARQLGRLIADDDPGRARRQLEPGAILARAPPGWTAVRTAGRHHALACRLQRPRWMLSIPLLAGTWILLGSQRQYVGSLG